MNDVHGKGRFAGRGAAALCAAATLWSAAPAARAQEGVHLGVATCASAPCHGAASPEGKRVLQNEYVTWMRRDRHSKAFETLRSDRSARIAANLELGVPAYQAPECLACHADDVAPGLRGPKFTLEDGVGCEACHGGSGGVNGAEGWLASHARETATHEENVARGLRPLDRPAVRAERCLDCHLGDSDQFVSHRIMGAGHPRMSFELDTFTQVQPAHFRADEDYQQRGKVFPTHAQVWAVGQAVASKRMLRLLDDPKLAREGIWPEFVFFDCFACHHEISDQRWLPRPGQGLEGVPGAARLDDAHLLMLRRALDVEDPESAAALARATVALHGAYSRGSGGISRALAEASGVVDPTLPRLESWQPAPAQIRALAAGLARAAAAGYYRDYSGSEQAVMAVQALAASLRADGALDDATLARINAAIERLLADTFDPEKFRPSTVPPELKQLEAELR